MVAASSPALALLLAASFASPALTVSSSSVPTDPFAATEGILQARLAAGDGPAEGLLQQLHNLAAARTLLGILNGPAATPLRQTIDLAVAASRFQQETLGTHSHPVAVARFDGPVPALRELAARHGATLGPDQADALQALDALPAEARNALTTFVAAFLALEDTSRAAFAEYTPPAVDFAARGFAEPLPFDGLHLGFDAASILAARSVFLATIPPLAEALQHLAAPQSHSATLSVPPAFSIDLATDSDTFAANESFVLVLDSGGDDTYNNNAGGNNIGGTCTTGPGAQAAGLLDLGGGADHYGNAASPGSCGVTGGGSTGAGVRVDGGGDDHYVADSRGANGGGSLGVGLLLDAGGADRYDAAVGLSCSAC
ncbi:MAG: hypothetical protein LC624_11600, partial [Halobacteriales archaeon]|nr:hypothetical protein [Halobacteriales archaeon]